MKPRMVELLCCPKCSASLTLEVFSQGEEQAETTGVEEGILVCSSCGRVFPVCEGVPRVYLGAIAEHQDFVEKHRIQLPEGERYGTICRTRKMCRRPR